MFDGIRIQMNFNGKKKKKILSSSIKSFSITQNE